MRQRWFPRLALLATVVLVATACAGGDGEQAGEGDVAGRGAEDRDRLVVGAVGKPNALDPVKVAERVASDILVNTTNRLVEFAPGAMQVGPGLATEWEVSGDGLTYTFTLREGVTFHDGSTLDSEDVKFSLERAMNVNHPDGASFLLDPIASIRTPAPQQVVIGLKRPNAAFLARLNSSVASILPSDSDAYRAPQARLEGDVEAADDYVNDETIVGTGPYRLADYRPGASLTLVAFEDYWGMQAPRIRTVEIRFFADRAPMMNALAAGEIDLNIDEFGPAERAALESAQGVNIAEGAGGRIGFVVLDVTRAPFQEPAVRRAVAATVDRRRIVEDVFEGAGAALFSMIPSGFEDVHADHVSDVQAGEPPDTPVAFDLWYALDEDGHSDVADTIARSLDDSGRFQVTTIGADSASMFSADVDRGTAGAYLLAWAPGAFDPNDAVEPLYSSKGFVGLYANPEMDRLITAQQRERDPGQRARIFDEIQRLAARDMPYVPLYEETPFAYYREGVIGVEDTMDAVQQTRYWIIDKT